MSSKLDYLKKYLSADEGEHARHCMVSSDGTLTRGGAGKKKRRKRTGGAPRGANVRVVDEDMHDLPAVSEAQVQEKWQEWDMGGVSGAPRALGTCTAACVDAAARRGRAGGGGGRWAGGGTDCPPYSAASAGGGHVGDRVRSALLLLLRRHRPLC